MLTYKGQHKYDPKAIKMNNTGYSKLFLHKQISMASLYM